jgi:hypothetical protein
LRFVNTDLLQAPSAASLCESMRSLGYTTDTAVADLLDNSVSAGAKRIEISIARTSDSAGRVAILDDGCGMSPLELLSAMKPGGRNPFQTREPRDLGRFGLGLKTASFSQGRCLTVATRSQAGELSVLRWDLDHVKATDRWELLEGPPSELADDLRLLDRNSGAGTLVLLSKIDAFAVGDADVVQRLRSHLGLVFHQFLERSELEIFTSMDPNHNTLLDVKAIDPFLRSNKATHVYPVLNIASGCSAQVYVLPHRDRCTDLEWEAGARGTDWRDHQGCYVYRNRRLLVQGGWFNLRKGWKLDAATQLARLRIEFTNAWDSKWRIDVLKSRATPPPNLRAALVELAKQAREQSTRVFLHRYQRPKGREARHNLEATSHIPVWVSEGRGMHRINTDHPVVRNLLAASDRARTAFRLIEQGLPTAEIWYEFNRLMGTGEEKRLVLADESAVRNDLIEFVQYELRNGRDLQSVVEDARRMEPFDAFPALLDEVVAELSHAS